MLLGWRLGAAIALIFSLAHGAVWGQIICIDPGHPSEVGPGTKGKFITELDAAWAVALNLGKILEAKGWKVVFTKSSVREYVTNPRRAEIANASGADLLIRLHCDHAVGSRGIATFYADRQGRHGREVGPSLETLAKTKRAAGPFHRALLAHLKGALPDRGLRKDTQTAVGAKHGALIGSIYSKVPSLLVEMCVLSSAKDEAFIRTKAGQARMASAIAAGIEAALKALTPASSATGRA